MIKTLTRHGNSYALVIEEAILDLLKFEPGAPLELSTDGTVLTIRRATDPGREGRLQKSLATVNRKHGKALKRLGE